MNYETETFGGFQQTTSTSITRVVDKITITAAKQFNLPSAMYRKNNLAQYKAARLFYNKQDKKIGLEFITELEEGAFKLIQSGENGKYGAYIVAKNFFFLNDLRPPKQAKRYEYQKINLRDLGADRDGTIFVIDLKEKEKEHENSG